MRVYVVHGSYHYDDYKRGESHSVLEGVFYDKEIAYEVAVQKYLTMFDNYAKYNWDEFEICEHELDEKQVEKENYICANCGRILTKEGDLDLKDESNFCCREHLMKILKGNELSSEEKYDFISDNLYEFILPEAEFSLSPTHYRYIVEEANVE